MLLKELVDISTQKISENLRDYFSIINKKESRPVERASFVKHLGLLEILIDYYKKDRMQGLEPFFVDLMTISDEIEMITTLDNKYDSMSGKILNQVNASTAQLIGMIDDGAFDLIKARIDTTVNFLLNRDFEYTKTVNN